MLDRRNKMIVSRKSGRFASLFLVGTILMMFLTLSLAGVSYSISQSSVSITDNSVSVIISTDTEQIIPDENTTAGYIEPPEPVSIPIIIDGEPSTATSYDVTPTGNLGQDQDLEFDLRGAFCIFLDINKRSNISINNVDYRIKAQSIPAKGYFTIIDGQLKKATGSTYEEQLQYIASNDLWIRTNAGEMTTFSFHQQDATAGSTPLRIVFAPVGT